jgi:hypothetical protein
MALRNLPVALLTFRRLSEASEAASEPSERHPKVRRAVGSFGEPPETSERLPKLRRGIPKFRSAVSTFRRAAGTFGEAPEASGEPPLRSENRPDPGGVSLFR